MTVPNSHVFIHFQDFLGNFTGNPINIPVDSSPQQLDSILNQFLGHVYDYFCQPNL